MWGLFEKLLYKDPYSTNQDSMESIQPGFFERGMKIGLLGGDEDWEDDLPRGTANYYRPFQKVVVFLPIGFSQIS